MSENKWKEKYLSLLDKEEKQPDIIEHLRRGLVEVSLTGSGIDVTLDKYLANLRKLLRATQSASIDINKINDILEEIAKRQVELESTKDTFGADAAQSLTEIIRPLAELGVSKTRGKKIISALYAKDYPMFELPKLLNELSELAAMVDFSKSSSMATNALKVIRSKTEFLINSLSVPPSMESRLASIKSDLESISAEDDIYGFIELFSQFIIELLNSEHNTLKDYLENLDAPLKVIENLLQSNDAHIAKRDTTQNEFKKGLTSGLSDIKDSLDSGSDIEAMKAKIQNRVEQITKEFVVYEKERNSQENELLNQYQLLKSEFIALKKAQKAALVDIERFQQKSLTDPLTQLPNRSAWEQYVDIEWQRFQRYDTQLSLAIVDIDYFKKINDNYGHKAGDNVLRAVARQLRKYLRSTDILARFGGEEFSLLLPETDLKNATIALNHVREKVEMSKFKYQGHQVQVTVSIGIAEADKSLTMDQLFNLADDAMYRAKNSGRNKVCTTLDI